ncbi:MAG: hypothetical protein ACQEQS_00415 [Thermodesulfobacteriota bacterium]
MENTEKKSWLKSWGVLILTLFLLWIFAFIVGPWGEQNIPVFSSIVEVIERDSIDSTAYMYTEIEGSYTGEKDLLGSLKLKMPEETGFTLTFMSGIAACIALLCLGYKFMPMK